MSLETKKLDILQLILSIDNEDTIDKIKLLLEPRSMFSKYAGEIEDKLDLKKIIKEKNYKGPNEDRINELAKEADIKEPIDDLLNMLD